MSRNTNLNTLSEIETEPFNFKSFTSLTGIGMTFNSKQVFMSSESEMMIFDIVKEAFAGKTIEFTDLSILIDAIVVDRHFKVTVSTKCNFLPTGKLPLMDIVGTANSNDKWPFWITKKISKKFPLKGYLLKKNVFNVPSEPYGIDILYPWTWLRSLYFFESGMSGDFSKCVTCMAINILKMSNG